MKLTRFVISFVITALLTYALNTKLGVVPPLGKFLNPFTGFWQNAEPAQLPDSEELALSGLKSPVTVTFDERLVPHVFAQNDEDLYFMQGYITARYRLWQMEVQTHNAAGRVSEIVGDKALESDRMQRRIGLGYGAESAKEFIEKDEASSKLVKAYCEGVNAYISSLSPKDYPIEYKLLDYQPEKWESIKVALLLKNMANMLSVFEYDIENHNFMNVYGRDAFEQLYPEYIADEDPIIPTGTPFDADTALLNRAAKTAQAKPTALYNRALQKPDEITGSNNWAVAGSKTKSGAPILCNDPHLRLSLPSIWYEMHLVSPSMNVYGATLPGSPAVIIGFNDSISWGVTNGGRDVRDWYSLQFKDDSRTEYLYNGKWEKSELKIEKFIVRGKGEVLDTVIYTRFGPVVYDKSFGSSETNKNLSMRWTAHLPSNEFKTFYSLNKCRNYNDYLNALNNYGCPAQNFVFASRSGDIAIKEQGRFPIRNKATRQGKFVSSGSSDADEWTAFIPNEHNPTVKNPARGFVSSANQHPTDSTYPYYYPGLGVYENYRNRRINQLLTQGTAIDADFMKQMQNDNYNLHASEALPAMLQLVKPLVPQADQASLHYLSILAKWDYYNQPDSEGAVYFEIWWNELRKLLWDEMQDKAVPMKQPNFYVTVQFLKNDSTSQFYDNRSTPQKETRADILYQSLKKVHNTLTERHFTEVSEPYGPDETTHRDINAANWANYKDTKVAHLAGLDPFSALHVMNGGNLGVINATNSTNGPSWRMIVDEYDLSAYVVYPGGQSGNPGSKYYNNMIDTWAKGEYYRAHYIQQPDELGKHRLFTATFKPKGK